jgi:hypothetical protein
MHEHDIGKVARRREMISRKRLLEKMDPKSHLLGALQLTSPFCSSAPRYVGETAKFHDFPASISHILFARCKKRF